ncbi:MAG: PEPxxWA-CTERM sorting domain-containing protein [Sphingobium sp.]|nr:PEPxxWA-CTERM sorting domain-containing protein [Sphingobium sp.]
MKIDLSKTLSRSLILGGALMAAPALAVPTVPPVPEPGTWAMMIFGFGLAGTMMRVRSLRTRKTTETVKAD